MEGAGIKQVPEDFGRHRTSISRFARGNPCRCRLRLHLDNPSFAVSVDVSWGIPEIFQEGLAAVVWVPEG